MAGKVYLHVHDRSVVQPVICGGCGPIALGNMCLPPLERLRSWFHKGAAFDLMLPSAGSLSVEKDREVIHISNRTCASSTCTWQSSSRSCVLKPTHAWEGTYIYAPYLVSAFVDEGLALRLRELHLGGNLSPKSEAVLNAGH
jgi:hypothetical protein